MLLLRISWNIFAFLLALLLLIGKLILPALLGDLSAVLIPVLYTLLCFYLLFLLEGLQLAGVIIREQDWETIVEFLNEHPNIQVIINSQAIKSYYEPFIKDFDGFLAGRQFFVIFVVISIAFMLKSLVIPLSAASEFLNSTLGIEQQTGDPVLNFLNGGLFAFLSSTLIPFWFCQLVSQFLSYRQPIFFLLLPFARTVFRLVMVLDTYKLVNQQS